MLPRINMIMVGAKDVGRLRRFYEDGLGWAPWMPPTPQSVLYKVGTALLVFLDENYQAKESGIAAVSAPKGIFAIFVESKPEVDRVFRQALDAGAVETSAVRDRDGGLYSGYFTDPEGNGWEVVWSPHMPLDPDGALTLPGQA